MKISEVISKLQEIQNEHGDIQVLALENTWASASGFHLKIAE